MRRKVFLLITAIILFSGISFSQVLDPVKWDFKIETLGDDEYELVFVASIDETWHLYSVDIEDGGPPIPTSFNFEESDKFELVGKVIELTEGEVVHDVSFDKDLKLFSEKAIFKQKIKVLTQEAFDIKGYVEFMCCDDERCLPPTEADFSFSINKENLSKESGNDALSNTDTSDTGKSKKESGTSMLGFFLLAMLSGFAGILTPCVFPMIPMTVAFFSQGSENRGKAILKGLIFGFSIILIYTSIGIIVSLTSAGAGFANNLSTHWIPNLIFFILFMVFAASFLGLFDFVLPSNLVNKADKQADKGGYVAAFFMGLTTVLVSFSCTGPIVGALLVEAASGEVIKPTIGMFGFGLAFALPFTLFAIFPSWMSKLPKSGGWLNAVKVVLGFIVLAFGMKFLLTIDLSYHIGIFTRDVYLAIWIVIFTLMGFYLLGKIKFSHDSDLPYVSFWRLMLVIVVFTFVVYLIPGMFGAPLKAISGLIPPMDKQSFNLEQPASTNSNMLISEISDDKAELCGEPKYADFLHLPHGLKGYFDYQQGMDCAKKQNKPVFLDFKGHACSNCKEMEGKVWSDPRVLLKLREEFIIIGLYVDDRTKLPENEWVTSGVDGKVKKTIGKVNADIQVSMFQMNSQPYYVIVDKDGNSLVEPMGHNLDIEAFLSFLDDGIEAYKKENK
ncbi:MAG: cytochrome c biogenesis protein CcdA [Bacteroidales bacterium]|nr:cytochrome c biogenesis protein CcdA [Bacteroidales bacterium]